MKTDGNDGCRPASLRGGRPLRMLAALALALSGALCARAAEGPHAGLFYDEFNLTLAPGHRAEAAGPFYYNEQRESLHTWAVPPLFSHAQDPEAELSEFDFLYPLLTYDKYGSQHRWQFFQLLSFSGGPTTSDTAQRRFTLFPLYFQQRSTDPNENYTAVVPFYGHLKHRLFRDEIYFVMFPIYGQSRKKDVVTDNYLYPIFHLRQGNRLKGWQFWPLVGHEHKDVTYSTNGFGDVSTVGGHDKVFAVWPLYFNEYTGMGTTNPAWQQTSLPAYSVLRSPSRDSTTVLWPFFNHVTDREKQYEERDAPWPLVVFAHGPGKTAKRVWPFYSHAFTTNRETGFYMWPAYRYEHTQLEPLDHTRKQVLFFLYSDRVDKNTDQNTHRRRVDFWPFYVYRRDFDGSHRLQVLALMETFVAGSHKFERDISPLWSVWRAEANAKTGATSQSLLWNLYRHETSSEHHQTSALFGLYQRETTAHGNGLRLFYIPLQKPNPVFSQVDLKP